MKIRPLISLSRKGISRAWCAAAFWSEDSTVGAPASGGKSGEIRVRSNGIFAAGTRESTLPPQGGELRHGGKEGETEKRWRELFSDPSQWRDSRLDKGHPRFPDFKHKKTHEALWLNSKWNPPWVEAKLAELPPGTMESSNFSWNQRLSSCVQAGNYKETMEVFQQMQQQGMIPNGYTFVPVLKACAGLGLLEHGRRIHTEILKRGFEVNVFLGSSLVDMYSKCGSIEDARRVFDMMAVKDVVAWNSMIMGYVNCGEAQKSLDLFEQMQRKGTIPDPVTFLGVLNACASLPALEEGRRAHEEIIWRGYDSDVFVGNCLVDMYAKCGSIEEAERVFNQMPARDVVAWNAMIAGCVQCGQGQKALSLFKRMQQEGVVPDPVTLVGMLNTCASVAALEEGRRIHEEIIGRGYGSSVMVGNCLVDMYTKCGSIEEAERVFNHMPTKNVASWTAMTEGYSSHGCVNEALAIFKQMCEIMKVDGVAFIPLLLACSHAGLVEEGLECFKSMSTVYNITPTMEHYGCVVDLLGRAGRLCEAEELITSMPVESDAAIWMSLLGACRVHGNVEMGKLCAKRVMELLDSDIQVSHVLLSNMYVTTGLG